MNHPPHQTMDALRIEPISTASDPRLDDFRNLNHSDKRPDMPGGKGLIIAEGLLVVPRLIRSRYPARAIMGTEAKLRSLCTDRALTAILAQNKIPMLCVTREVMADVVGFDMHRGLLASADRVQAPSVEDILDSLDANSARNNHDNYDGQPSAVQQQISGTIAVLEGVGDHENIGAVFRNAAALGVDAVLFGAGCADPLYRRVVRVSMGHVLRVPFAYFDGNRSTWQRGLVALQQRGYRCVALTPSADARMLSDALDGAEKVALLVGAEGPGLTEHAMRATDVRARIPMAPGTDSLNVATAVAMGFYERSR